jgi:hypothetical protein
MTAHMIADPTVPGTAVFPTAPGWDTLSAALTAEVPVIADRDDLLVTTAPGAGHGAPACFLPALATIEVDGVHFGHIDPATAKPHLMSDRARYAPAWGALTHECAHSAHTRWTPPRDADPGAVEAALLLEEPRIEAAQVRRRPDDRHWLRACVTTIVTNGMRLDDPAVAPAMTEYDAAHTAALFLGRTDGGILTRTETAPLATTIETVLGAQKLRDLRALWRTAFTVADDDADAMLELGRRWCELVGPDPRATTPPASPSGEPGTPADPSPLADAIGAVLGKVSKAVAREEVPIDPAEKAARAKAAEEGAMRAAMAAAAIVFDPDGPSYAPTRGTRPPTDTERTAARVLGRALTTAGIRDRVATKTTSALPPGRLRMRGALARAAQQAAGAIPTAEPFTRITRATVPTPPLRLGIACDVSGSMGRVTAPVASAAWILANATRHTTVPADTATVIFGRDVHPITRPGTVPTAVTEFAAPDGYEAVDDAIDALDGALGLSRPGAARLLVIVSDGDYRHSAPRARARGQRLVNRLRTSGCAVLWLATSPGDTPLDGSTVHVLTDPTTTARDIGRAATAALRATH